MKRRIPTIRVSVIVQSVVHYEVSVATLGPETRLTSDLIPVPHAAQGRTYSIRALIYLQGYLCR